MRRFLRVVEGPLNLGNHHVVECLVIFQHNVRAWLQLPGQRNIKRAGQYILGNFKLLSETFISKRPTQ